VECIECFSQTTSLSSLSKLSILNCSLDAEASRLLEEALVNGSRGGSGIHSLHQSRRTRFVAAACNVDCGALLAQVFGVYRSPRQPQRQEIVVHDAMDDAQQQIQSDGVLENPIDSVWIALRRNARCVTLRALTIHSLSLYELLYLSAVFPIWSICRSFICTTAPAAWTPVRHTAQERSLQRFTVHLRPNEVRYLTLVPTMIARPRLEHNHDTSDNHNDNKNNDYQRRV